ncbi:RNA exonuclease 4 like protein [Argiope bruennichi]|uniref:RNA exonuclease 4 n=1 Tax=Argiope bruennichi TaxID=94029 RepID=A0A8T0E4P7_ARGBR|nr:RNA exonuclease 4 like protein [Argiope bruennichi]
MEISSKHQKSSKKRKRKKKPTIENGLEAVVKPECFDGLTNWTKLQQVRSFLSHTKKFLLGILITFVHFSTILCDIISQTLAQVRNCLSIISQKVLEKNTKERVSEDSKSAGQSRFSKSYKKKRINKNSQNKNSSKKMKTVEEFEFDFNKRRDSNSTDTDVIDNEETERIDYTGLTKTVALDCEMVGVGPKGKDSILARVSIVNAFGNCIYDEYVKPKERITDYRTEVSGVRPADLQKGKDLYEVQKDVLSIIDGRRVVGHDLKHDFDVLFIGHPRSLIRDTSKYKPFRELSNGRTPSLKKLASVILNLDFQSGEHNSVQDAQVAMMLYLKHKKAWERSIKRNRRK